MPALSRVAVEAGIARARELRKEGIDFKKQGPKPTLDTPDEHIKKNRLVVDWYPKNTSSRKRAGPCDARNGLTERNLVHL
jgi:hypothetical protein